ncbi:glycosyltransferase family 4 protein [Shewanella vesiculosa]|uniref:glycosyltransferase family 4 protein n=1 Tax=Shewanella vesiculosa TaxID=518738 RepID=UPI0014055A71|nr:glycosyltransferase family 4 protein [Shewanella vesiculosa]UJL42926.1 glycosyltransferase family 4 protein [Shewanella vesiculosa]
MKNVLFVSNFFPSYKTPNFGTFVKTSAVQLESMGFHLDYSVVKSKYRGAKKLLEYIQFLIKTLSKLFFKNYHFCYVHYLTYSTIPLCFALLFGVKFKFFINIHGDDLAGNRWIHKIMGLSSGYLLRKSTGIIVPSEHFRRILLTKFPSLLGDKIFVSPSGGVNVKYFFPMSIDYTPESDSQKVFGFVSRIEEGKGWEDLLNAIEILPSNLNIKFVIYGSGNQEVMLNRKLASMTNRTYVHTFGGVTYEEMPKVFNSMDFFVFPTHRESLGLVLLESMSCGIPTIVTKINPLIDIVGDDYSLFADVSVPKSLSEQILKCYKMKKEEYIEIKTKTLNLAYQYDSVKVSESLCEFITGKLR